MEALWGERAELAQEALIANFWDEPAHLLRQGVPQGNQHNRALIYWWHAHALDVLIDAYERTHAAVYRQRMAQVFAQAVCRNGGTLLHNYYDDMEWMALALLRAWDCTGEEQYRLSTLTLWQDIQTAWNSACGGGMAWKKDQRDYKNTPANAPAAILACRLYRRFGKPEDLAWAERIYAWNKTVLVDPISGFVWDGINRQGDSLIDKDWRFTYCQGVFLGAATELYLATKGEEYIEAAVRTATTAIAELVDPTTGLLPDEGDGDCGLFKGILVRYLTGLVRQRPDLQAITHVLVFNAEALWERGRNPKTGLFSYTWGRPAGTVVDLSAHLSGVMLTEAVASMMAVAHVP